MSTFRTLLIANRGEIAARVVRTARAQGYRTVAVHSEADAAAPHVKLADDAVLIGPGPVGDSYLRADRIIAAAKAAGADAVHPGYGFLSENADFADACADAGLVFVGPPASAIRAMGNKAAAKRLMIAAGVPCVPGYQDPDQSDASFVAAAERIGFPVMVKAAAGGGGRGMRLVHKSADLVNALATARSEAQNAFGSGELILEKAVVQPRHVEIQVFADAHGTVVHLGERDCSVQRRHQKVVEEAPCPVMTPDLRAAMGAAAVEAARAIGYRGAGTVEFLLDVSGEFYFLEMNTRLQVEHPVTELVTGLDLVALQLRVAEGRPLGFGQDDVTLTGHAIEVRLYAEDPATGFLPATGPVEMWEPATGPGVRIDAGIATGLDVSPFYDPMLAKVIAYGADREEARQRLIGALKRTHLFGTVTNKRFLIDVLSRDAFAEGKATTAFIAEQFTDADLAAAALPLARAAMAAVLLVEAEQDRALGRSLGMNAELLGWTNGEGLATRVVFEAGEARHDMFVHPAGQGSYRVATGSDELSVAVLSKDGIHARLTVDGRRHQVAFHSAAPGYVHIEEDGVAHALRNAVSFAAAAEAAAGGGRVTAPMPGLVREVLVEAGQTVATGARLLVLEAMKMQHEILAGIDGTVTEVLASAGKQVAAGDLLVEIEAAE
ncbi:MAG: acetyl-CoA carboxylase biotin carboxylase subunit [Pseudomonadota bacterium]|nr:acetyl-CoA carboxylase biotin carboxylase subunit [Pseudomonadota bacterium]